MRVMPFILTTAALLMVGAGPAAAAGNSIAEGDALYAINCDRTVYNDWQLLSVDASTAVSTTIGDGSGSIGETPRACAGQPAHDPTTGISYYIQWLTTDGTSSSLATIDLATGASTTIGQFFVAGDPNTFPSINSIAIGLDGTAYAFANLQLYKLNLSTGELTLFRASLQETDAFAVDPSTGRLYTIDISGSIFEISGVTGADSYIDSLAIDYPDEQVRSLQIDSAGTFWIEVDTPGDDDGVLSALWSFTIPTIGEPVFSGYLDDDPYHSQALLLVPRGAAVPDAPLLPATGASAGAMPLAVGALLLGGALLVAFRRTKARTS